MRKSYRLASLKIVDVMNCPESILLETAEELADDLHAEYKWEQVEVKRSRRKPQLLEDGTTLHFFSVYGVGTRGNLQWI